MAPPPGRCAWPTKEIPAIASDSAWLVGMGCELHRVGAAPAASGAPHLLLDPVAGAWEKRPGERVAHAGVASSDDAIFMVGGMVVFGGDTLRVRAYELKKSAWRDLPPLPHQALPNPDATGLEGVAALAHDGRLYAFGGRWVGHTLRPRWDGALDVESGQAQRAWVLDGDKWRELPALPRPSSFASAVWFEDRIWLVGGGEDRFTSPVEDVVSFDPVSESWRTESPLARPTAGGVVVHHGRIYAFSSFVMDAGGPQIYDPEARVWRSTAAREKRLPSRLQEGVAVVDDRIVVLESDSHAQESRLFEYIPTEDRWLVLGAQR
ncbi:MAG: hypothetical protein U0271_43400 [Polyangiaceae bacterium]